MSKADRVVPLLLLGALFVATVLVPLGCTDAQRGQAQALGAPGHVVCYSGGKEIYRGTSTGGIVSESPANAWLFKEVGTDSIVQVSGDCVIKN